MEKFCPLGRLQRHTLELSLLLVLYMVTHTEFLFSRKVGSHFPDESVGKKTSEAIHLQS